MRSTFARLVLFLIPVSLLLGKNAAFRIGGAEGAPIYWFELLAVALAVLVWPDLRRHAKKQFFALPQLVRSGAALMVPALLISVWVADSRLEAAAAAVAWFIVPMLLAGLIILSKSALDPLYFGIVILALGETAYSFSLQATQPDGRFVGTFTSANHYAAVLVPAFFLSLLLPMKSRWVPMLVLLLGLLQSQSLGGFIGLLGGCIYLLFALVKSPKLRLGMALVALLIGIIGGMIGWNRFADNPRSSMASRQEIWQVAWHLGKEHPVTGIGLRSFDTQYSRAVPGVIGVPIEWGVSGPHNLYLGMWLFLSLFGLVALLMIVIGSLAVGGVAVATLVALLSHGLVDTTIFELELAVLFWIYIALILSPERGKPGANLVG